jgi:hypothetical protein
LELEKLSQKSCSLISPYAIVDVLLFQSTKIFGGIMDRALLFLLLIFTANFFSYVFADNVVLENGTESGKTALKDNKSLPDNVAGESLKEEECYKSQNRRSRRRFRFIGGGYGFGYAVGQATWDTPGKPGGCF